MSGNNQGYIKIYRKLLDNPYCKKPHYAWLWVYLLLKANHKDTELLWDNGLIKLNPGQFVTGRNTIAEETGIKPTTIERILKVLETGHQIGQQKNNKFRIITIVNWSKYQENGHQNGQQTDNKRTTNGQQTDTDKNDNNDKNEKKGAFAPPSLNEVKDYCNERKNKVDPQSFVDFYESKGWFVGKNKMKDWRAAVRTWEGRDNSQVRLQGEDPIIPSYAKAWAKQ